MKLEVKDYELLTEEQYYYHYYPEVYDDRDFCPENRILLIWLTPESFHHIKNKMKSAEKKNGEIVEITSSIASNN